MNHLSGWWASLKHLLSSMATHSLLFLPITLKRQGDPLHSPSWNKNSGGTAGKGGELAGPVGLEKLEQFYTVVQSTFFFRDSWSLKSYKYIFKRFTIAVKKRVFPQELQICSSIIQSKQM